MKPITALTLGLGLAACGKVTMHGAGDDIGGDDGSGGSDAAPTSVTVHTYTPDHASPAANVEVVFEAPGGGAPTVAFSDGTGTLVQTIVANTTVTVVVRQSATNYQLMTVYGAQPGDTLDMRPQIPYGVTAVGTQTITVPSYPQATGYSVQTRCVGSNITASVAVATPMYTPCETGTQTYAAIAQVGNGPAGFFEATADASSGAPITLTGAYQPYQQFNLTLNGLDATAENNGVYAYRYTSAAHNDEQGLGVPSAATQQLQFPVPTSATALVAIQTEAYSRDGIYLNEYNDTSYHKLGGSTFSFAVDVGATRAPRVEFIHFDDTQANLVCDTAATGTYAGIRAEESYYNNVIDPVGGGTTSYYVDWTFVMDTVPTTAAPRPLPKLPDDAKIALPLPAANRNQYNWYVDALVGPVTWDQVRNTPGSMGDIEAIGEGVANGVLNLLHLARFDDS